MTRPAVYRASAADSRLLHDGHPVTPEPAQDDPVCAGELTDPGAPAASQDRAGIR